jgi:hypothetical protein
MERKRRLRMMSHWLSRGLAALIVVALCGLTLIVHEVRLHYHHHPLAALPVAPIFRLNHVPTAGRLLTQFSGMTSQRSQLFKASVDWHIYWQFECAIPSEAGSFAIIAYPAHGQPRQLVSKNGESGYGDLAQTAAGNYSLGVNATKGCDWKVAAKSLI